MPYINTTANISISKEQELRIKSRYAQAVSVIGKSEAYLMLGFNPNTSMYVAGNGDKPTAFVEVKFFGTASGGKLNMLTKAICEIINSELGISPSQIYVKYEPTEYWGWNGRNF